MTSPALTVVDMQVKYGGVVAVRGVSLTVAAGAVVTVLGANGAGKTSLLRGISGLVPGRGSVVLGGRDMSRTKAAARARAGLGHVLEGRHVFQDLTVAENLHLGSLLSRDASAARERALDLFPELREMLPKKAGQLSGGQQQMLAIARAVGASPSVILLDEPTNGLAPILVKRTIEVIRAVSDLGVAVLLVEQRLEVAQELDSEVLILQRGEVIGTGSGSEEGLESRVHASYLA